MDFTFASPYVDVPAEVEAYARVSFTPGRPLGEAATELMHRVHDDFAYRPRSTIIGEKVVDLLVKRHGVCQDFSHVMVAGLRSLGLAGRYVSGYLATRPPPGRPRLVGADASHAWVGVWVPGARLAAPRPDERPPHRRLPRHRGLGPRLRRRARPCAA